MHAGDSLEVGAEENRVSITKPCGGAMQITSKIHVNDLRLWINQQFKLFFFFFFLVIGSHCTMRTFFFLLAFCQVEGTKICDGQIKPSLAW